MDTSSECSFQEDKKWQNIFQKKKVGLSLMGSLEEKISVLDLPCAVWSEGEICICVAH